VDGEGDLRAEGLPRALYIGAQLLGAPLGLARDLSELASFLKDLRDDVKALIKVLTELDNHVSTLSKFASSVERLVKEMERTNRNVESLMAMLRS
jgi:ABC-type transporter Mla subunit MlaD